MIPPTPEELYQLCLHDSEFQMAARYWTGGVRFKMGSVLTGITIEDGALQAAIPDEGRGVITIEGPQHVWDQVRSAMPPRFLNDINIATGRGGGCLGLAIASRGGSTYLRSNESLNFYGFQKRLLPTGWRRGAEQERLMLPPVVMPGWTYKV